MTEQDSIGAWLYDLASEAPAPGGGAAAAMAAAMAAALVSMVCNLTTGKPRYAEHQALVEQALATSVELRSRALALVGDDATAFDALSAAYRLPKQTDAESAARTDAIQQALGYATEVPLDIAAVADEVIGCAESLLDKSNANLVSDLGVAASVARAAIESAMVNVEINVRATADQHARERVLARLGIYTASVERAGRLLDAVRQRITG